MFYYQLLLTFSFIFYLSLFSFFFFHILSVHFLYVEIGEYYAKNNPFQKSGPKGAVVKIALAKSDDLYMRVDMPGVPNDKMFYFGDPYNFVFFGGSASKEWEYDQERKYRGFFGRPCRCCQVTQLQANLINGVLRMRSSKVMIDHFKNYISSPFTFYKFMFKFTSNMLVIDILVLYYLFV